jgi:hypothetical protein
MPLFYQLFGTVIVLVCVGGVLIHVAMLLRNTSRKQRDEHFSDALNCFRFQREVLEADFVRLARKEIDPKLWLWEEAQFGDDVVFARHRKTGEIIAYVPVIVELNRPIRQLSHKTRNLFFRNVTVVMQYQSKEGRWITQGRALFNLLPNEAIQHRGRDLEYVCLTPQRAAHPMDPIDQ